MGPVASQEAIKMLGTNGGGFFNANSAHPFENPTPLTNFLQMLAIFLIPAGLCALRSAAWSATCARAGRVLAAMTMFVVMVVVVTPAEQAGNPLLAALGVDQAASALQSGGNMEGKEARFGIAASAPVRRDHDGAPRAARSTRCTTPSRRWAAWCRWC